MRPLSRDLRGEVAQQECRADAERHRLQEREQGRHQRPVDERERPEILRDRIPGGRDEEDCGIMHISTSESSMGSRVSLRGRSAFVELCGTV